MVTCTYEVAGNKYYTSAGVPGDGEYSPSLVGGTVLITYDPLNPQTSLEGNQQGFFKEYIFKQPDRNPCSFLGLLIRFGKWNFLTKTIQKIKAASERKKEVK
jgi:hypothetical protein